MDLNDLFSRHQLSLVRATSAGSPEARREQRGLADGYASRIAAFQVGVGAGFTSVLGSAR